LWGWDWDWGLENDFILVFCFWMRSCPSPEASGVMESPEFKKLFFPDPKERPTVPKFRDLLGLGKKAF